MKEERISESLKEGRPSEPSYQSYGGSHIPQYDFAGQRIGDEIACVKYEETASHG
jgi:hypothetical protein